MGGSFSSFDFMRIATGDTGTASLSLGDVFALSDLLVVCSDTKENCRCSLLSEESPVLLEEVTDLLLILFDASTVAFFSENPLFLDDKPLEGVTVGEVTDFTPFDDFSLEVGVIEALTALLVGGLIQGAILLAIGDLTAVVGAAIVTVFDSLFSLCDSCLIISIT